MSVSEEKAFEVAVLAGHWRLREIEDVFAQFLFEVVLVWYSVQYSVAGQVYIQMLKFAEKSQPSENHQAWYFFWHVLQIEV